jgi:hypothetical protein
VNPKAAAFCGIDLHQIRQARKLIYMQVQSDRLERDSILSALQGSRFTIQGNNTTIPASGNLTFVQELSIAVKQPLCRPWAG